MSSVGIELTRVNGIGLWNSWTRNFKTPLLALLDLFDNAIDAPLHGGGNESTVFPGKIHVLADTTYDEDDDDEDVTGIYMINNSSAPIKDIRKILEVYASEKGKDAESIGENGVGLKQGCATLSDMSFVLIRNDRHFSLGVIAAVLQQDEGVYLPSFQFKTTASSSPTSSCMDNLSQEMKHLFTHTHTTVGQCISMYGDGNMQAGIDRLIRHFTDMTFHHEWQNEQFVFSVILHNLKHGGQTVDEAIANSIQQTPDNNNNNNNNTNTPQNRKKPTDLDIYSQRANGILKELEQELPHHYIHIPQSFTVVINRNKIDFFYWQQRLVELSEFYIKIDKKNLYTKANDWVEPKEYDLIRIFCGFDPLRLGNKDSRSTCSLHIYSRQSGRLIKYDEDARAVLRLNNSGTTFCQGLSVIVDDMQGYLPLNPTKQDIAFGEETHGEVHKTNLFAWVGAIAAFFYNHHLDRCDSRRPKSQLYEKVQNQAKLIKSSSDKMKCLDQGEFTRFSKLGWFRTQTLNIRVKNKHNVQQHLGKHTLKRLNAVKKSPKKSPPKKSPKKKTPTKRKKMDHSTDDSDADNDYIHPHDNNDNYGNDSDDDDDDRPIRESLGPAKKKRAVKTRKKVQHNLLYATNDSDSDNSDSTNDHQNVAKILMLQEIKELKESLSSTENELREEKVLRTKAEQRLAKKKNQNEQLKASLQKLQKSYTENQSYDTGSTQTMEERDRLVIKLQEQKKIVAETIAQMKQQQSQLVKMKKFCDEMDASNQAVAESIAAKFEAKIALLESELKHKAVENNNMHQQLKSLRGMETNII